MDPVEAAMNLLDENELFYLGEYSVTGHKSGSHVMRIPQLAAKSLEITGDSSFDVHIDISGRKIVLELEDA